jgi:hypothetical protein
MAGPKRNEPDRIGVPNPEAEALPPELDKAGDLGLVGEQKMEETGLEDKDRIWKERPKTPPEKA